MSLEIKVPPVGESISEVTLSNWVKNDGDHVEMDDVIAELESDKATFELTAEAAGTLKTTAKEGDVLPIGAVVCSIEPDGTEKTPVKEASGGKANTEKTPVKEASEEAKPAAEVPKAEVASVASAEIEIKIPAVGESIQEVTLTRWMKKDGDQVEMDEPIAELESDKATFELNAESAGTLSIVAQEGDVVAIGALVGKIKAGAGAPQTEKTEVKEVSEHAEISAAAADQPKTYASGVPSPAAAKILAERGLDPKNINGNGVAGRITKEDALKAEVPKPSAKTESKPAPTKPVVAPQPAVAGSRNERREKMSSLRKTVAKRLVAVKNETAMLTTFNEVDMQPIMELRTKYKDKFKEKHQVGLGFMSFFTKAVTEALKDWPAVGARIEGEEVVYSDFADISIAVSAPKGLVVPIIRNADAMSLAEIEKAIVVLAGKARENKLSIDEMTGGTFTITNGGVFGSMLSTPIINSPQSAILGMHNIIERPVAMNGQVVIRPMMYLALSYDHRIVDGRESVSFLVRVKQLLEDPARLLLGV